MTSFQSGIIAEASSDALFITLNIKRSDISKAKQALASVPSIVKETQEQFPDGQLHASVGLSSQVWSEFDQKQPKELAPFPHIKGQEIDVVPTDVDLVLHIRSSRHDASYELGNKIFSAFGFSVEAR
ncbi:Dyp-type peroxidase domain-containing protein [Marinomonas sp. GJ51-6]|uniref:Dyp-type peroxidase domain-containing protein n=1 Tax=Marinomonas sp. GJ51-6 TaxID=2992802 RepID=UPI0029348307|nr:Dyp-type peroxidase domain-containing protein [Marinomonas sp. GJ51-6]WOD07854.1 Dyp-type peroxidase [Marinomonas sp. GJ51-6]